MARRQQELQAQPRLALRLHRRQEQGGPASASIETSTSTRAVRDGVLSTMYSGGIAFLVWS